MKEKDIVMTAKVLSAVFNPFFLPVVGLLALFIFSYLSLLPWTAKLYILVLVATFTILLPTTLIRIFRRWRGWSKEDVLVRERRIVPYIITIICYLLCYHIITTNHIPYTIGSIVMASLIIHVVCAIVNHWWKISTRTAAIGGVAGALMAFAEIFSFNPLWWLSIIIILAGMVGTSRIILGQHTLAQVVTGFLLGMTCAILSVLFI